MLAVLRALKGTVELLVNSGANIDQEGPDGDTAVHLAVAQISVSKVTSDAFKSEEIRESGEASPDINAVRINNTCIAGYASVVLTLQGVKFMILNCVAVSHIITVVCFFLPVYQPLQIAPLPTT